MSKTEDRKILGFTPIYETEPGSIATQCIVLCSRCRAHIKSNNGPMPHALCKDCTDTIINGIGYDEEED